MTGISKLLRGSPGAVSRVEKNTPSPPGATEPSGFRVAAKYSNVLLVGVPSAKPVTEKPAMLPADAVSELPRMAAATAPPKNAVDFRRMIFSHVCSGEMAATYLTREPLSPKVIEIKC